MARAVRNPSAVVLVVVATVGELFLEALADQEPEAGVDGQVSGVE